MKKTMFLFLAIALVCAGGAFAQNYRDGATYKYIISVAENTSRNLRVQTKLYGAIDTGGVIQMVNAKCAGNPNIVEILDVQKNSKLKPGQKTTVEKLIADKNVASWSISAPSGYFVEFAVYDFNPSSKNVRDFGKNRKFGVILPGSVVEFYSGTSIQIQSGAVGWDDEFFAANNLEDFMTYLAQQVDYNWVKRMVDDTKKAFDKATTKGKCPVALSASGVLASSLGAPTCPCRGDINEHIILNATLGAGAWGALWGFAPPWLLPAEFFKVRAQFTAQAYLGASIGYLNGRFPTGGRAFQAKLKSDCYVLFAGSGPDDLTIDGIYLTAGLGDVGAGTETIATEVITKSAELIMKHVAPKGLSAVPIAGTVWSVGKGAYEGMKDAQTMGKRAVKYYTRQSDKPKTAAAPKPASAPSPAATALKALAESALKAAVTPAPKQEAKPAPKQEAKPAPKQEAKPAPAPAPVVAPQGLNGVWQPNQITKATYKKSWVFRCYEHITISGNGAVFTRLDKGDNGIYVNAKNNGRIKIGDPFIRNIQSTGAGTWSCQVLCINGEVDAITGTEWKPATITIGPNGKLREGYIKIDVPGVWGIEFARPYGRN